MARSLVGDLYRQFKQDLNDPLQAPMSRAPKSEPETSDASWVLGFKV